MDKKQAAIEALDKIVDYVFKDGNVFLEGEVTKQNFDLIKEALQCPSQEQKLDELPQKLLNGDFSSLSITYNDHACNYVSVKKWLEEYSSDENFVSEEEKNKAIENNSLWSIQWYPDTPIGFYRKSASSFEAIIKYLQTLPSPPNNGES